MTYYLTEIGGHWSVLLPDNMNKQTVHVLNASVMPHAGYYHIEDIDIETFAKEVEKAYKAGTLIHYISYRDTLTLIEHLTGIDLGEINFDEVVMADQDIFLVIRLTRRGNQKHIKRQRARGEPHDIDISDFCFSRGVYRDSSVLQKG